MVRPILRSLLFLLCLLPFVAIWAESDIPGIDDSKGIETDALEDLEKSLSAEEGKQLCEAKRAVETTEQKQGRTETNAHAIEESLELPEDIPSTTAPKPASSQADNNVDPEIDLDLTEDVPPAPKQSATEESVAREFAKVPEANPAIKNEITNLEFKMDGKNSHIVVDSKVALSYREVKNPQMKQLVYFFDNTTTPEKLQRAYDTTEFQSPVALFTLLQIPGEGVPLTKLIVQLREEAAPSLKPSSKGLRLDFGPSNGSTEPKIMVGKEEEGQAVEENIYSGSQNFSGKVIRQLEIKNSEVQDVLRLLARTSGYNIVVGDDVVGKVGTLSLENIPWDQAFALVLQTKKLGYVRQGNVLRVGTLSGLASEKSESLASERARLQIEPLKTVVIPVSYAKAQEIAARGKNFLTPRGTIDVDSRTNQIIVKDVAKVVERLQKLISALDTQPPRVSITARIVEMRSILQRDLGFQNISFRGGLEGININQNITPGAGGSVSNTTIAAPDFANLLAIFNMAEEEKKAKILANPSISVVANQEGTISQSITYVRNQVVVVAGGVPTSGLQQVTANLNLRVLPIVAGDGTIFLNVSATNEIPTLPSDPTGQITIESRRVETQILIENGDTAVVGSVFANTATSAKKGIPFLMHIPLLGFLVSSEGFLDAKNETFVFLTAKIMNPEEAFKRAL